MMEMDFLTSVHAKTKRNYMARVTNKRMPKYKAAEIAKQFGYEYWDGDRDICYGGHYYIDGWWSKVAKKLIQTYKLENGSKVLDVGCGKGFLLYEIHRINPLIKVYGIDISTYAIENAKEEIKGNLRVGSAQSLAWGDNEFDLVISINTLHNLYTYELEKALYQIERVGKKKYICVESYRNELEKQNLLFWQVTCEEFNTPKEWIWWFKHTKYSGDYSFIYFE